LLKKAGRIAARRNKASQGRAAGRPGRIGLIRRGGSLRADALTLTTQRVPDKAAPEAKMAEARMAEARTAAPLAPERVYFRFIRLHQRLVSEMGRTLKATGLSIPQFDVLSTLTEQQGLSQSDLAARLYVTKGNVSGLIDRLVEGGLVERRAAPGDRRSHAVYLTLEGRRVAEDGIRLQKAFVAETLGRLGPAELKLLDGILTQWRDAVRTRVGRR